MIDDERYRTGAKKKNLKQSSEVIAGNIIRHHFLSFRVLGILILSYYYLFFYIFFFWFLSGGNLIISKENRKT